MFKRIFGNQKGVSLIEVTVASAVSIIVAMGVMKINENAQKGMSKIQGDAALHGDFRSQIVRALSDRVNCTEAFGGANVLDIRADAPLGSLTVGGQAYATVGQRIPIAPDFEVLSINVETFDNNGPAVPVNSAETYGECKIRLGIINRKLYGDITNDGQRNFYINTQCTVDQPVTGGGTAVLVQDCISSGSVKNDGHWLEVSPTGEIAFSGTGTGTPRTVIGNSGWAGLVTSGLTIGSDTDVWAGGPAAESHGIALPQRSAITFGNADNVGLWSDAGTTIESNGSFDLVGNLASEEIDTNIIRVGTVSSAAGTFKVAVTETGTLDTDIFTATKSVQAPLVKFVASASKAGDACANEGDTVYSNVDDGLISCDGSNWGGGGSSYQTFSIDAVVQGTTAPGDSCSTPSGTTKLCADMNTFPANVNVDSCTLHEHKLDIGKTHGEPIVIAKNSCFILGSNYYAHVATFNTTAPYGFMYHAKIDCVWSCESN